MKKYKLTQEAIKVFDKANELARSNQRNYVDSSDFLLASMQVQDTGAGYLLFKRNVMLDNIKNDIDNQNENAKMPDYNSMILEYPEKKKKSVEILNQGYCEIKEEVAQANFEFSILPLSIFLEKALKQAYETSLNDPHGNQKIDTVFIFKALINDLHNNASNLLYRDYLRQGNYEFGSQTLTNHYNEYSIWGTYLRDGKLRRKQETSRKIELAKNKKVVASVATDMIAQAKAGKYGRVEGRDGEVEQIKMILARKNKNNALLLGKAGIGKTAIIESLANQIAEQKAGSLNKVKLLNVDALEFSFKAKFNFQKVIDELTTDENTILFIDEIHMLLKEEIAERLKPFMARGDVRIIGATTDEEWGRGIKNNPALERRFEKIIVAEPSIEATNKIINKLAPKYENYFHLNYDQDVLDSIATLAKRYYQKGSLPDTAITLLDTLGASVASRIDEDDETTRQIKETINGYENNRKYYQEKYDNLMRDKNNGKEVSQKEIDHVKSFIEVCQKMINGYKFGGKKNNYATKVTMNDLGKLIKLQTKKEMSLDELRSKTEKLQNLNATLKKKVIGQDEAVDTISRAVLRSKVNLSKANKPKGVFAFFGPTGVGKTEVAKVVADEAFDGNLIRIDMSEYKDQSSLNKLLGSNPGFIGFGSTKTLVDKIIEKPNSVVLFDEIEKAHESVFDIFLQLFDEGKLTDGAGKVGDFTKSLIILTSNIGYRNQGFTTSIAASIGADYSQEDDFKKNVEIEVNKYFRPEILNRIDERLIFNRLTQDNVLEITANLLQQEENQLKNQGYQVEFGSDVIEFIAHKYYDENNGARPIKRGITKEIEDVLANGVVFGEIKPDQKLQVFVADNKVIIKPDVSFKELEYDLQNRLDEYLSENNEAFHHFI